jgi:predicted negative regulator of RcsB-dependent stress response
MQTAPTTPTSSPDPLLATQLFWERYKMVIIAAILAIIVIVAAWGTYRFLTGRKEAAAAAALSNAKGMEEYQRVIAEYPSSGASASAHLLMAAQQREKQQFLDANATLQRFIDKFSKHHLVTTAKMGIAGNLESLGKPDEALEAYRRLAAEHPKSFNAPLALLAQVQLLKGKGQIDEARRVCETVITQFRESFAAQDATRLLRTLKPTAAPPVAPSAPGALQPPSAEQPAASVPAVVETPAASVAPTP